MRKRCITRSTESSSWTALTRAFCRGHSQVAKRGPKTEAELQRYRGELGDEEYRRQYEQVRQKTWQHIRKDVRFSGREYTNSLEKLEAIKEKYKDGVRPEHVEALVEAWLRGV